MSILKKIEIELINFKLKNENLELMESQLKDGTDDLHFRLSHFRKRVSDKDLDRFDVHFFGAKLKENNSAPKNQAGIVLHEKNSLPSKIKKDNHNKKDPWLKKLYREIVSSTHPDKFTNFPVESLKEKYLKIYRKTIDSWQNEKDDQLLLCAYETDINISNPKSIPILKKGNKVKNKRIKEIQNLLAYQWYHISEHLKPSALEEYLKKLGYEFTDEEIKKVINLPRKRKVGTRPESLRSKKTIKS